MDLAQLRSLSEDVDPETIPDPATRQAVSFLFNVGEHLVAENAALKAQVQQLKDEIARLKGEQGKPTIPPNRPAGTTPGGRPAASHSSEDERRRRTPRKPWRKRRKLDRITIDRAETLSAFAEPLPADARFKGWETVVIQDLVLKTDNVRFRRAKYYSPSTGRTYLAPLPPGYQGQFGPGLKTLALTLVYGSHLSQPLLHTFFEEAGIVISRGQVAHLVTEGLDLFHTEQATVLQAGLASSPWQHLDVTPTRVDGVNHACHVLGNPLFSHYHTTPRQDRRSALDVLRGGAPRTYRLDATVLAHLTAGGVAARTLAVLRRLPPERTWNRTEFRELLARHLPRLGRQARQQIEEAALLAAYQADPDWPVVTCLVADDAAALRGLTREAALCWIHDGRHYTKLLPQFACHRRALQRFRKQYWDFYRDLLAYRDAPTPEAAAQLEAAFDRLFGAETAYADLNVCIRRTQAHKEQLLLVLRHPELPLHNNPAELTARRRVRKRDVSFGPRSPAGVRAWDTFQGLAETTRKLGLRFTAYLRDRLTGTRAIVPLADLITTRAAQLRLGASWAAT